MSDRIPPTAGSFRDFFRVEREFVWPDPQWETASGSSPTLRNQLSGAHRLRTRFDACGQRFVHNRNLQVKLELQGKRPFRPLQAHDFPAIFLTHNSERYVRSYLQHYRQLGVTRFLCVDDQTTDASLAYLLEQPDVDVYSSNVRYSQANRGRAWREQLVRQYGYDRWYLNLDNDEYFVYPEMHQVPLPELAARLQRIGLRRLCAPMLDMYPLTPLAEAEFDGTDDRVPWEVAPCFDGADYRGRILRKGLSIAGGVRQRLLGATPELVKYPLLYWTSGVSLGNSIHVPYPTGSNFTLIGGVLLHFKIFADFRDEICRIIENGQHVNGASHYRKLLNGFDRLDHNTLGYEQTLTYTSPEDLLRRGFLHAIPA